MAQALLMQTRPALHQSNCSHTGLLYKPSKPFTTRPGSCRKQGLWVTRAAGYNGKPFSRSGTANEDLLEEIFTGLVDTWLPGSNVKEKAETRLAVDVFEEENYYAFYADIPGVRRDQLKVTFLSASHS